ncbi:MAG: DUF934 domain-containing protein [Pseudomonadota bacterium]
MPTLIKSGAIAADSYTRVDAIDGTLTLPAGDVLVGLDTLLAHRAHVLTHVGRKGVQLKPDQFAEQIADLVTELDLVAVEFPAFADGRGYSTAYLLRTRFGYTGELRAVGDVFKDTLFYQARVGFDAFAIRDDKDAEVALRGLEDFSEVYHASADQPRPLFLRRAI